MLALPIGKRDHMQGPEDASVTLVEYGDYECPHCGQAYYVVKEIQDRLGDRINFVYRSFPLAEMHPHAQHAAEAAEAAGAQGKFWEMHAMLYEHQHALDDSHLVKYAGALHLDVPRFLSDMKAHTFFERVREDFESGLESGVNGTPTFYLDSVRYIGSLDYRALLTVIEEALQPKSE